MIDNVNCVRWWLTAQQKMISQMEDNITNEKLPHQWKMTWPIENDIANGRWPHRWKMTTPTKDGFSIERVLLKWKMTYPMDDDCQWKISFPTSAKASLSMDENFSNERLFRQLKITPPIEDGATKCAVLHFLHFFQHSQWKTTSQMEEDISQFYVPHPLNHKWVLYGGVDF